MHGAADSPARVLAPLALVVCTIAFLVVVLTSDAGDDSGAESATSTEQPAQVSSSQRPRSQRRTYTVKVGDSLGAIAEKTGVDVETLQELNPELDPQALTPGQKIKLQE